MAVQTSLCSQDPLMASSAVPFCGSQDWALGSALGIGDAFSFQSLLQHIPEPHILKRSSHSFTSELEKQRLEMDRFLQLENQKLRKMVMEEQSRQQSILLQGYESRITGLLRQRDADLAIARNKTRELQDLLIGAELEAKLWEKKAMENEAIVSELSNRLSQVRERDAALFSNSAQDAESFCGSTSAGGVCKEQKVKCLACKMCQSRSLSVVFLPCRHLCCCKSCDAFLELCPVCAALKEDSIEVILG